MAEASFQSDAKVLQVAKAYSLDAVDIAARNFGVKLDWSEASIRQVEKMLGQLHDGMSRAKPPEDAVWTYAKTFGSYVGEVVRRQQGCVWGTIIMDGQSFPGLQQSNGGLIWPWSKVHQRLTNGAEDNVWHYYKVLVAGEHSVKSSPNAQTGNQEKIDHKNPWWKFW
jgi:hypothetical protein